MSTLYPVKIVLLLAFMTGYCFAGPMDNHDQINSAQSAKRVKRTVAHFGLMILCATGRNPLDYNGYGCWCGLGGSGNTVDATDRCCKVHDQCYDQIVRERICGWDPKWVWYKRFGCTGCAYSNTNCGRRVCQCDGAAARCFARSPYNRYNKNRCY